MPHKKDPALESIASSIVKPLLYASRDGFARLNSVKGLEQLIRGLSSQALGLGLDAALSERFREIDSLFTGFDRLDGNAKKEAVKRVLVLIGHGQNSNPVKTLHEDTGAGPTLEATRLGLEKLQTPLRYVKGIGPKLSEVFASKGLRTVEDLLYFLPIRYEDRRAMKKIRELRPGMTSPVEAEVLACGEVFYGRRRVFEAAVGDGTGILKLKWFNFKSAYLKGRLKQGERYIFYGTARPYGGRLEIIHPDMEKSDDTGTDGALGLVPVYSQVENFHQKTIRKVVGAALGSHAGHAVNGAPGHILKRHGLMGLKEAFVEAHQPGSPERAKTARQSLVFDELFMLELGLALKRGQQKKESGIAFPTARKSSFEERLRGMLPFTLTGAQERALTEIKADMAGAHPMNRLIQGDVGCGKTIVSFISAAIAMEGGFQAAIMAPTEILAEQHYLSTHRYCEALGIRSMLLAGETHKAKRKEALETVRSGSVDLIIGTHALIQKDVEFAKLGLAVIDEQHRFGVVQRSVLKKKGAGPADGTSPDILIMTATPIPRTLAMTVFGDLDVTIIDELPPGRHAVHTRILREKDRNSAYSAIRKEVSEGRQCYIVYPLVEESEEMPLRDATTMKEHLQRDVFKEFKVGLLHGRMDQAGKEATMRAFKAKELDILVSTTVIEVGVDVSNATIILIEHAERFGLAQLHQLRGRVGRGAHRSYCLLLAQWTNTEDTYKRLKVMEATMDGFKIAEEDLKIRGPGDFLGTRQAGLPEFRTAEALTDLGLLKKARQEAFEYLGAHPGLAGGQGPAIKEVLKARWAGRLELAEIG